MDKEEEGQREVDLPPKPKKRAKTKASPSPSLSSESPTLLSLSQGDFICTITKEGSILEDETEAIGGASDIEIKISEVLVLTTSEAEPQPNFPSNANLEPEIYAVRHCATALRVVKYDKETFNRFEGFLSDLKHSGVEVLQHEFEVKALYRTYLASSEETFAQLQSLIRSYDDRKASLLSYQGGIKNEDSAYSVEIKAAEEERERPDIYIHQLKTKQDQKRVEARNKSQEFEMFCFFKIRLQVDQSKNKINFSLYLPYTF
ncbi:hypothetical protein AMTR_s00160p00043240 [Amborella trichopoda]|uniref:Uncharacterized protein n=1 Tax=Amborella trichopoda TaxID=13333 RepID=W1PTE2_AMBTC|nr:hypothetical protein AMTR_s00160p00043240 [Amborella trichopoda]